MKKSKKLVLICVIIIGIIIVGLGIGYYILDNKDKQKETDIRKVLEQELGLSDRIVEYGTEINILDEMPKNVNFNYDKKIYVGDKEITDYKFDEIGEIKFTEVNYTYYNSFLNQTKKVEVKKVSTYTVEDTKKPIVEGVTDKEITVGDSIDLKEGIIARDEVDGDLEIIIEGNVDTNTAGEYTVNVMAKDKNGNITEDTYIVKVNNKSEAQKKTNRNVSSSSNSSANKNTSNNAQSTSGNTKGEQSTYNYETYGDRIYFEEDRGENGNYSEKFTW